ncbi:hypothetical protein BV22DRAFT_1051775 [Leucogyrophana mollusca]|uniref:Uncharacterized protein n=1 Tax=Leucogyrophana mollusca TaxID=85980 RepID=A0ACB8AYY8_9AGAM|nr:hypothetical protein BV22DRAFT_1051775 [Leucogyrophana mollusca]
MSTVSVPQDSKVANLTPDIHDHIFGFMSVGDTAMYRSMSRNNSALPLEALAHRKQVTLATFVTNVTQFIELLRSTCSVVSGSLVLRMLFPYNDVIWNPTDMDIYTPLDTGDTFVAYCLADGYRVVLPNFLQGSYGPSNIAAVVMLVKGALKFHSTTVMNYMSADILFSAYPVCTTTYGSIVNGIALRENQFNVALCQALVKYSQRGFSIVTNPSSWEVEGVQDRGVCSEQIECPQTVRNSFDAGCLRVAFDPALNADEPRAHLSSDIDFAMRHHIR